MLICRARLWFYPNRRFAVEKQKHTTHNTHSMVGTMLTRQRNWFPSPDQRRKRERWAWQVDSTNKVLPKQAWCPEINLRTQSKRRKPNPDSYPQSPRYQHTHTLINLKLIIVINKALKIKNTASINSFLYLSIYKYIYLINILFKLSSIRRL